MVVTGNPELPSETGLAAGLCPPEPSHQRDLDEATKIQQAMLPKQALFTGRFRVMHEFQPVLGVGGDFLDYFNLPNGQVGLYIGDVCGKGLPAALYAAMTVGILRGIHKEGQLPGTVLSALNRRMTTYGVTCRYSVIQYAVFDPASGTLQIASAGMSGPFHVSQDGCRELALSGLPPGMFANASYETHTIQLEPGDSAVFCTDGLVEAMNPEDEFFGSERLSDLCGRLTGIVPGAEYAEHIFTAVEGFSDGCRQHDDMAVVVLNYSGGAT